VKLDVRVADARELGGELRELTLAAAGDEPLPAFSAGSHIRVYMRLPEECCNAYSLTSSPWGTDAYRIVVRRSDDGAGGSRHIHEAVGVGDVLRIDPPRNLFAPPATARRHVLVAGGVGLTPFLAYAHRLERAGVPFELHHVTSDASYAPLHDELRALAADSVRTHADRGELIAALDDALGRQPLGTHLSLCGPEPMMEAVDALARAHGWPGSRIHSERFAAASGPMEPFEAVLGGSGRRVAVDADKSLLEALEGAGLDIPFLCRQGVCGECRTGLVEGEPDHRDVFLTTDERASHVMPCVSRCARDGVLVLDLD
jgi:ferredoxin-NADP reductase